jgi:hypothetical protein
MIAVEPVGKRAVIVMTDGRDERDNAQGVAVKDAGSLSAPDDPINEANRHNIPILSVGLAGVGGEIDTKYLRRLAERTGGEYKEAPQPEELTPIFQDLINQLKQQYVLTYDSSMLEDDQEHSIMVRVQLPQGHAFNETKFEFRPGMASNVTEPESDAATPTTIPLTGKIEAATATPAPEPTSEGIEGIVDTVQDTIEDDPLLVAVIGAGIVLLLILIIALVIVLLRGRKREDAYMPEDFEDIYAPAPSDLAEPSGIGTPVMPAARDDRTEAVPQDWSPAGVGAPPVVPPPVSVPAGPGPGVPQAGGTRVIERGPKHLAMLVDKAQPDRRYDLKGTTNVGRAQDNQIVLEHPTVSRHHAWIKAAGEEFRVFDVGSANGTFVNDEQVTEPRLLQNGDEVRFGEMKFAFTQVF